MGSSGECQAGLDLDCLVVLSPDKGGCQAELVCRRGIRQADLDLEEDELREDGEGGGDGDEAVLESESEAEDEEEE